MVFFDAVYKVELFYGWIVSRSLVENDHYSALHFLAEKQFFFLIFAL